MNERSYADIADSATTFDPELEYDKQIDYLLKSKKRPFTFCGDCQTWYPSNEQHLCSFPTSI